KAPGSGPSAPPSEVPRGARRFTNEEVDEIVRHLTEADTPQPGHPQGAGTGPRGFAGEQGMGFHYSQETGWGFLDGPSGSGGHASNAGGPDGFAFRTEGDFEL